MQVNNKQLVIEQLDISLKKFNSAKCLEQPKSGWIKAIRTALGMTMTQLAKRLEVSTNRVSVIEQSEISGTLTINSMKKIANQLDCTFVYGVVPRQSLKHIIKSRAMKVAKKIINNSSHTMFLEKQVLPQAQEKKMFNTKVKELTTKIPHYLWEET
ncbi:MAG: mobile mystery protein A [Candidatus Omnitrophica bacterium]|nr:mobile mystery protein A [Candidatus Omnitrophota bacterium]